MRNIFAQTKDYVDPPKRNVFDLSHSNHSTFQFGYLYPVLCQPVIPGDSFDIDPTFALRFLPTAFPVQTKITANLHFFYVRNRNLWDKWTKFIGHTHDTEFPYLDGSQDCIKTGGLADYLGIPTTLVGAQTDFYSHDPKSLYRPLTDNVNYLAYGLTSSLNSLGLTPSSVFSSDSVTSLLTQPANFSSNDSFALSTYGTFWNDEKPYSGTFNFRILRDDGFTDVNYLTSFVIFERLSDGTNKPLFMAWEIKPTSVSVNGEYADIRFEFTADNDYYVSGDLGNPLKFNSSSEVSQYLFNLLNGKTLGFIVSQAGIRQSKWIGSSLSVSNPNQFFSQLQSYSYSGSDYGVRDISNLSSDNPFLVDNPNSIRLNALPFRAYESIYNAFYRNEQNDPLMINGEPEYDKYLPNDGSGADSFPYQLYKRNWELDFLSSAVQSPQQGIAPLVGVSSSGDFTFVHKDDNGNIGYFSAKAQISADGKSISGVQLSDSVELDGLPTTPIVADIPESVKRGSVYTLNQMALAGISINDFRNVNSLQRWLETNIRRGFKYRDQIKSHFGIDVDFDVLDMPEFIGGISEPVYSSQVNQTSESENDPLGSYAGQLSLIASSKHSIRHYCHEHGYIIGIFSVIPVPNYSQLLPKDFIKSNYLDFYFPEFSHIGMQPVDYREVCPLQAYGVNPDNLLKTFGYQRPWYDYIANVDSVHGLFRTNLRNFVLNRQFDTLPMLNKDFLQVDPSQLNDIFTVDDVSDKILGQIQFNIIAKRPIPRFGIPRLE